MQVLSTPRSEVVRLIRVRADRSADPATTRYHADLIDKLPGETLGDALYQTQLERQQLLQTRHRCLAAGLGLFAVAGVNAVLSAGGPTSGWVTALQFASTFGGAALVAKGGMTGDKIDRTWHKQAVLTHWSQQLRHEGTVPAGQGELARKLAGSDGTATKAELIELLENVKQGLADHPGAQKQVEEDLKRVRGAVGETLDSMRAASELRGKKMRDRSMLLFGGGTVNMLALMVTAKLAPTVGIVNSVLMSGLFGAGIFLQDKSDQQALLRDTLDRWELQLGELKEVGRLGSNPDGASGLEVRQGSVVVGGVRVPVKVRG